MPRRGECAGHGCLIFDELSRALQSGLARRRRSVVRAVVRGRTTRALHTLNSITLRHTRDQPIAVWPAARGGKDPPHETPHTSPTQLIPELSQKHEHRIFVRPSAHSFSEPLRRHTYVLACLRVWSIERVLTN